MKQTSKTIIETAARLRFVVISYDKDEQQTFFDTISVDSQADDPEEDAKAIVDRLRPYAVAVAAIPPTELVEIQRNAERLRDAECLPFREQVQGLSREQCTELLEGISIQVYDNETDETLREAVRANLEDGTLEAELNDLHIR